jgi:hypothetical protein
LTGVGIHAEGNRNKFINEKVTKRSAAIHTERKRYTTGRLDRFQSERKRWKVEKKVIIRYSIKKFDDSWIRRVVEDRGRVFYEPLNREGFSSHVAEFGA